MIDSIHDIFAEQEGKPKRHYSLSDAVEITRQINGIVAEFGYFAGLTGSTILGDGSDDDCDVIVYPSKTTKTKIMPDELICILENKLSAVSSDRTNYHEEDTKIVYHLSWTNWEVDIFMLS